MILTPFQDTLKITALVQDVEVWPGQIPYCNPVVRDNTHVGIAGQLLAQHLNAVVSTGQVSAQNYPGEHLAGCTYQHECEQSLEDL